MAERIEWPRFSPSTWEAPLRHRLGPIRNLCGRAGESLEEVCTLRIGHGGDCAFVRLVVSAAPDPRPCALRGMLGLLDFALRPPWPPWEALKHIRLVRTPVDAPRQLVPGVPSARLPMQSEGRPIDYPCEVFATAGGYGLVRWTDAMIRGWVAVAPLKLLAATDAPGWSWSRELGWARSSVS